jgi:hypothetical protein
MPSFDEIFRNARVALLLFLCCLCLLPFVGTALLRVKERPKKYSSNRKRALSSVVSYSIPTLLYKYSTLYRNFLLRYISKAELLYHNM